MLQITRLLLVLSFGFFHTNSKAEEKAFRDQVMDRLAKWYPDRDFQVSKTDPHQITLENRFFGLTNLNEKYLLTDQTSKSLDRITKEFFTTMLSMPKSEVLNLEKSFPN